MAERGNSKRLTRHEIDALNRGPGKEGAAAAASSYNVDKMVNLEDNCTADTFSSQNIQLIDTGRHS